ncbi:DUF547 domain-containing protein [uncultured Maricaulis sp.]|uniref:DUF547 domain-containing protein n=1 Tax=uncultured Maricaulis sp. TaxID=174710 RepID=UPI0030DAF94D|tara:strand:- start:105012 stop:106226 length:1215 start_codon:yes stop_codon:yes gene_type:complete
MYRILITGLVAILLTPAASFGADAHSPSALQQFSSFNDNSRRHIDYSVWSDLLHDFVLNVPIMDRKPERQRTQLTGSRALTSNESRYRFEANRVAYNTMSDEYRQAITEYREDLEALPSQIDLASLSRTEQLAYWLNLHNVAIIEQIMLEYPVTRINSMHAHGSRENVFDAKILTVNGVPLSLNDIRLRIVYAQWDDPRVIYGFFNGAIGGPELPRDAYDATRIWGQLDRNATEFVNSLRGVEVARTELRVSHIYREAERFFPNFDTDLRAHLNRYANAETQEQVNNIRPVRTSVEDWHIADLINGSTRCTGTGGPALMYSTTVEGAPRSDAINAPLSCTTLPSNGVILMTAVQERRIELMREGRYGEVRTIDIPTDQNGNRIHLRPAGEPTPASDSVSETSGE